MVSAKTPPAWPQCYHLQVILPCQCQKSILKTGSWLIYIGQLYPRGSYSASVCVCEVTYTDSLCCGAVSYLGQSWPIMQMAIDWQYSQWMSISASRKRLKLISWCLELDFSLFPFWSSLQLIKLLYKRTKCQSWSHSPHLPTDAIWLAVSLLTKALQWQVNSFSVQGKCTLTINHCALQTLHFWWIYFLDKLKTTTHL